MRAVFGSGGPGIVGIGDDAAVIDPAVVIGVGQQLLVASDSTVEGVHVDLEICSVADFGFKAVTTSVSDIAAMGGTAFGLTVDVCFPLGFVGAVELASGIAEACERYQVAVIGGDTTSGSDRLMLSVTALGLTLPATAPLTRAGARSGDEIWVSGPTGASGAGLRSLRASGEPAEFREILASRHRRPVARTDIGPLLAEIGVEAAIDVSDGLVRDLYRICEASQVGVELESIPLGEGPEFAMVTQADCLFGGEDFELLFCARPGARFELLERFERLGVAPPLLIGKCTSGGGVRFRDEVLADSGYEHSW